VANDIPASAPKPLGGRAVFIAILPPHRGCETWHITHIGAITNATLAAIHRMSGGALAHRLPHAPPASIEDA